MIDNNPEGDLPDLQDPFRIIDELTTRLEQQNKAIDRADEAIARKVLGRGYEEIINNPLSVENVLANGTAQEKYYALRVLMIRNLLTKPIIDQLAPLIVGDENIDVKKAALECSYLYNCNESNRLFPRLLAQVVVDASQHNDVRGLAYRLLINYDKLDDHIINYESFPTDVDWVLVRSLVDG